jgi:hypothetical protein
MAEKATQHFVPQFYFRLFNERKRYIHLVTKTTSRIIHRASVRKQCARHKYYGSTEFEDFLSTYDSAHGRALNILAENARGSDDFDVENDVFERILEFLMLQRSRVPRAANKIAEMNRQMTLTFLREILLTSTSIPQRLEMIEAINNNTIIYEQDPLESIMLCMQMALPNWPLFSDLNWAVARNCTDMPFVFGDSPVVLYNQYLYEHHHNTGTVGYMCPGLMAILPIGTDLQLVLYDASVYSFSSTTRVVNILDRPVVSRLNALQVLSSIHNVYFGGDTNGEYVRDLIDAHRVSFRDDFNVVRIMPPGSFLVDGVPSEHEILHTFEQQLPISLDLPFLNYPPAPSIHQIPTCRNENLAKTIQPTDNVVGGGSLSADQFLQETLPRIQLPIT